MDDQARSGWAQASVRVLSEDVTQLRLPSALRDTAEWGRHNKVVSFVVPNPGELRLHDLLERATAFLHEHEAALNGLPGAKIDLFLGWSPEPDQDSLIVSAELIGILSRLEASIFLDTYRE